VPGYYGPKPLPGTVDSSGVCVPDSQNPVQTLGACLYAGTCIAAQMEAFANYEGITNPYGTDGCLPVTALRRSRQRSPPSTQ
jgi:hypothetical protein